MFLPLLVESISATLVYRLGSMVEKRHSVLDARNIVSISGATSTVDFVRGKFILSKIPLFELMSTAEDHSMLLRCGDVTKHI